MNSKKWYKKLLIYSMCFVMLFSTFSSSIGTARAAGTNTIPTDIVQESLVDGDTRESESSKSTASSTQPSEEDDSDSVNATEQTEEDVDEDSSKESSLEEDSSKEDSSKEETSKEIEGEEEIRENTNHEDENHEIMSTDDESYYDKVGNVILGEPNSGVGEGEDTLIVYDVEPLKNAKTIVDFVDFEEGKSSPVKLYHVAIKNKMEILEKFPKELKVKLSDGTVKNIPVSWKDVGDYTMEHAYGQYIFRLILPEEYKLSKELADYQDYTELPFIVVDLSDSGANNTEFTNGIVFSDNPDNSADPSIGKAYYFSPRWISGVTSADLYDFPSDSKYKWKTEDEGSTMYYVYNTETSKFARTPGYKGTLHCKYKKVGWLYIDGDIVPVDMKITINDYSNPNKIGFSTTSIKLGNPCWDDSTGNVNNMFQLKIQFYKNGTTNLISDDDVKGHIHVEDLDSRKLLSGGETIYCGEGAKVKGIIPNATKSSFSYNSSDNKIGAKAGSVGGWGGSDGVTCAYQFSGNTHYIKWYGSLLDLGKTCPAKEFYIRYQQRIHDWDTGGTAADDGTAMSFQNYNYGVESSLPTCTWKRNGYKFRGYHAYRHYDNTWACLDSDGKLAWWKANNQEKGPKCSNAYHYKSIVNQTAPCGTVRFYGCWDPYVVTIKYNANGGSGTMEDSTRTWDGSGATLKAFGFEPPSTGKKVKRNSDGYVIWSASTSGSDALKTKTFYGGEVYKASDFFSTLTGNRTVTLKPTWVDCTHTLTVKHGTGISSTTPSGSSSGTTHTYTCGTKVSISATAASGRTFSSWSNPSGKSVTFANSAKASTSFTMPCGDTTIKANTVGCEHTVTITKGAGINTVSGAGKYNCGDTVTASATVLSSYGYPIWSGYGTDSNANDMKHSFTMPHQNVALSVKANPNNFKITFDEDGGAAVSDITYNINTNVTLPTTTKSGYTFGGWTLSSTSGVHNWSSGDYSGNIGSGRYGNVTLKAIWTTVPSGNNTIAHWSWGYTKGEGNNSGKTAWKMTDTTFSAPYGNTITLGKNRGVTIPNGFSLDSMWSSYVSGALPQTTKQIEGNMYFEYNYNPISYSITYNLNGGTNNSANPATYNVLYGPSLANPTRAGYTFLGWYDQNGAKVTSINYNQSNVFSSHSDMITKMNSRTTGNITLTAKWKANGITFNYWKNDDAAGSVPFMSYTVTPDYDYSLYHSDLADSPTRSGYTFTRYYSTTPAGDGKLYHEDHNFTSYADLCAKYGIDVATENTVINLFAQWEPNSNTITYNSGLGLPAGYKALSYIQSDGSQYINTGIKWDTNDLQVRGIYSYDALTGHGSIFGSQGSQNLILREESGALKWYASSGGIALGTVSTGQKIKFDLKSTSSGSYRYLLRINDGNQSYGTGSTPVQSTGNDIYLFDTEINGGRGSAAASTITCKAKLYELSITKGGTLVRNYLPCENPAGVVGLYDTVSGTFFPQTAGNAFKPGEAYYDAYKTSNLPKGYERVEYLASTGTQYIDTGFKTNQNTRVRIEASYTGPYSIYGAGLAWTNFTANASGGYFYYNDYAAGSSTPKNFSTYVHVLDQNKNVCYLDGEALHTFPEATFTSPGNLFLFGRNNGSGSLNDAGGTVKIYNAKIYDNGTLVRDLVPCKNSSGTLGMYDLVNNVFYTNAGSGSFTSYGSLPSGYTELEYVETTGSQYVDVGLAPTNHTTQVKFDSMTYNNDEHVFGTAAGASYYHFTLYNNKYYWGRNGSEANGGSWSTGPKVVTYNRGASNVVDIDGAVIGSGTNITSSSNLTIARRTNTNFQGRYYYFKVYNNNTGALVRDMIPCKNASGVAGFYDKVNNVFYSSATSTPLVAGPKTTVAPSIPSPSKEGYTFGGWYENSNYSGSVVSAIAKGSTGNKTLYAKWTETSLKNTISHWTWGYTNNEGNNSNKNAYFLTNTSFTAKPNETYTMGEDRATTIPNGFKLRSTFGTSSITGSWSSGNPMGREVLQNNSSMSYEYDYDPISYTITYNMNGGTNHSSNPSTYNVLYGVSLKDPTRTGYVFDGWYIGADRVTGINEGANATFSDVEDLYAKLSNRTTGNITVTAKWKENPKLTVNPNGGTYNGSTALVTKQQSPSTTYTVANPTRSGYRFAGWKLEGAGSLSVSNPDYDFTTGSGNISIYNNSSNGNVTFNRVQMNTPTGSGYALKFDVKGEATPGNGGFLNNTYSKSGVKFVHVFIAKLDKGMNFSYHQNATGDGRTIQWLTSNQGTGDWAVYAYQLNCGTSGTFSTFGHVAVNGGKAPFSWYLASSQIYNLAGDTYTFAKNDATLTAQWEPETYKVTYNSGLGLPTGYKILSYIESTGTQYIDTGYKPTSENLKIEATYMQTSSKSSQSLFGTESNTASPRQWSIVAHGGAGTYSHYVGNSSSQLSTTSAVNTKHTHVVHANGGSLKVTMDGTTTSGSYSGSLLKTSNILIFANNIDGTAGQFASNRMYSFKIYDNNTLVRDMVPCENASGVAGMYDLVGGVFYANAGTGKFNVSEDYIDFYKYDGLPSGYEQIEYIQGTGTQYIDTGLTIEKTDSLTYCLDANITNDNWGGANGYMQINGNILPDERVYIKGVYDGAGELVYANGSLVYSQDWETSYNGATIKVGILRLGNAGNTWFSGSPQTGYVYGSKIYKNGVLVREYVPCKNASGTVGLYDKINGTFYTNAGTGTFTAGPSVRALPTPSRDNYTFGGWYDNASFTGSAVKYIPGGSTGDKTYYAKWNPVNYTIKYNSNLGLPSGYKILSYIESTGTQYIDTGVVPTNNTGFEVKHSICEDNGTDNILVGARETSGDTRFWMDIDWSSSDTLGWGFSTYTPTVAERYSLSGKAGTVVTTTLNYYNERFARVDRDIYDTSIGSKTLPNGTKTVYIFAGNNQGTAAYFTKSKVYHVRITEGNTLIRNLIPCESPEGVAGMYDTVGGKFYKNMGTGTFKTSHPYLNVYSATTRTVNLPSPAQEGYTFEGWYDNANFTGSAVTSIPTGSTGNKEFWAKWSKINYKISYDLDGGSLPSGVSNPNSYDIESEINLYNPQKKGYNFLGWKESNDSIKGNKYLFHNTVADNNYSGFKVQVWTTAGSYIEQIANSTGSIDTSYTFTGTTGYYKLRIGANGNKADNCFYLPTVYLENGKTYKVGWDMDSYTNQSFTVSNFYFYRSDLYSGPLSSIFKWSTGDKHYVAVYEPKTVTLTFNKRGGTGGTDNTKVTYGSALPDITVPTKVGGVFRGYHTFRNVPSSVSKFTSTARVNLTGTGHEWSMTTAGDEYRHITADITVVDSSISTQPTIQFNDKTLTSSMYTVTKVTNGWNYKVDFDITPAMVTAVGSTPYDTTYRFFDFEGVTSSTTVTVNSVKADGTMYYDTAGKGTKNSDFVADETLYARWQPCTHTLTVAKGTGISAVTGSGNYPCGGTAPITATAATGYQFSKWTSSVSGVTVPTSASGSIVMPHADITLTASATPINYKITYDENGGTSVSDLTYNITSNVTLSAAPTRVGYTFAGWKLSSAVGNWSATTYSASQAIGTGKYGNITLVAQWTKNNYTLSYNPNGGSVSPTSQSMTYGSTITSMPTPTKTGYTFNRWYADFTGSNYLNMGREYMYEDKISVHFEAYSTDWSKLGGSSAQRLISCTESGGWNIEGNGDGYKYITFAGYDKGVGYKVATATREWSSLAAGWHTFDLVFDGSKLYGYVDGTLVATSEAYTSGKLGYHASNSLFVGAEAGSSATTPAGSYFTGRIANLVIKNDSTRMTNIQSNLTAPAQNTTVYAEWTPVTYKITYDTAGGTLASGSSNPQSYNIETSVVLANATKTGHTFKGWKVTTAGGNWTSGTTYTNLAVGTGKYGNVTLTAQWEANSYAVNLDYNKSTSFKSSEYLNTGYKINWDKDFTITEKINVPSIGGRYLIIGNYNDSKALNIEIKADGSLRTYLTSSGAIDKAEGTITAGEDVTVTFTWNAATNTYTTKAVGTKTNISYTGTYDMSGSCTNVLRIGTQDFRGSVAFSPITVKSLVISTKETYGSTVTLPTATQAGYTCNGWFTAASGGTKQGATITVPANNVTYYAQWSTNSYTNTIQHWSWGFKNAEGNNSDKSAFKLGNTTFAVNYDTDYTMNASRGTTIPNGFYLKTSYATNETGSWVSHTMPKTHTQPAKAVTFEYDYYPTDYTITYNLGSGASNGSGNPAKYNVLYGVSLNNPSRTGYTFTGWNIGTKKNVLLPSSTGNYNYANVYSGVKAGETYSVSIDKASVTTGSATEFTTLIYDFTSSKSLASYKNTFGSNISYNVTCPSSADSSHDIRVIVYAGISGSTAGNAVSYEGLSVGAKATGINVGANATFSSADDMYTKLASRTTGDVVATALWTPVNYTITYDLQGGALPSGKTNPTSYNIETATFTLNNPEKTGHIFVGWTGTGLSSPTKTVTIPKGSTGNRSYTANWEEINYTVTYNSNIYNMPAGYKVLSYIESTGTQYIDTGYVPSGEKMKAVLEFEQSTSKSGQSLYGAEDNKSSASRQWSIVPHGGAGTYAHYVGNSTGLKAATTAIGSKHYYIVEANNGTLSVNIDGTLSSAKYNGSLLKGLNVYLFANNIDGTAGQFATNKVYAFKIYEGSELKRNFVPCEKPDGTVGMWDTVTGKFYGNSGSGVFKAGNTYVNSYTITTDTFSLPTPTVTGHIFEGWYDNSSLTGNKVTSVPKGSTGNKTFYAKWSKEQFKVSYHGNGGAGSMSTDTVEWGGPITIKSNTFTHRGYKYVDWTTKTDNTADGFGWKGSGTWDYYNGSYGIKDNELSLNARWAPITYKVAYNANGGTGTMADSSHTYNNNFFNIWSKQYDSSMGNRGEYLNTGIDLAPYIDANGVGKPYLIEFDAYADKAGTMQVYIQNGSGAKHSFSKSFSISTGWNHYAFEVTPTNSLATETRSLLAFYGTYDTGCYPHVKNIEFTVKDETLSANTFTKTGYKFVGWNTKADGSGTSYTDKDAVKNLTITDSATVTLYAQWEECLHTVTVTKSTGITSVTGGGTYKCGDSVKAEAVVTKNYTFAGWTATGVSNSTNNPYSFTMPHANVTLEAKATPNTYTITCDKDGGTGGTSTLYEVYATKFYTNTSTKDAVTSISVPTRTGYIFGGYYTADNGQGSPVVDSTGKIVVGTTYFEVNTTIHAKWTPITYTVKYDPNGATFGTTASSSHTYDEPKTLTPNGYGKPGFEFDGWNTEADGSGDDYTNKQSVKNLTSTNGATVTLYAQWKLTTYSIKYNLDGGTVSTANPTSYNVNTVTFKLNNPTKAGGYRFDGWERKLSTVKWYDGFVNLSSGELEDYNSSYPNSVYSELLFLEKGRTYTINGTGLGDMRWRYYTTSGTYGGNVSGYTFTAPYDCYVRILPYEGCSETNRNNATITYNVGLTPFWNDGYVDLNTGEVGTNSTFPNALNSDYIKVKAGVTYTLSGTDLGGVRWMFYDTEGDFVSYSGNVTTFTPTADGRVRIMLYNGATEENRNAAKVYATSNGFAYETDVSVVKGSTGNLEFTAKWTKLGGYVDGVNGNDRNSGSTPFDAVKTFKQAYTNLKETGGTIYVVDTVKTTSDITLTSTSYKDADGTVSLNSGKSVNIKRYARPTGYASLEGFDIWTNDRNLIEVVDGELTLGTITIDGHRNAVTSGSTEVVAPEENGFALVKVGSSGTLSVAGATLQNNYDDLSYGGAIYNVGGTVNMTSGTITNNSAPYTGGGGIYNDGGTITISKGTISNNNTKHTDGTEYRYGGGIETDGGTITLGSSAVIKNNSAIGGAGVDSYGGRVYVMGAEISGNTATSYGGGIANDGDGMLTIQSSSSKITNNTAVGYGGGICNLGTFSMSAGTISGNSVTGSEDDYGGGGIYNEKGKSATITGGSITNNSATNSKGGGIYNNEGTVKMFGGTISGNTAPIGEGVYQNGTFETKGSPTVSDTVYLEVDRFITVVDECTTDYKVGLAESDTFVTRVLANYTFDTNDKIDLYSLDTSTRGYADAKKLDIYDEVLTSGSYPYRVLLLREVTITFDKRGGTGGTDSVDTVYGRTLPDIDTPTKLGYIFSGYGDDDRRADLSSSVSKWSTTARVDLLGNETWGKTTDSDKLRSIKAVITVIDSSLSKAPVIQFNDITLDSDQYKVEAVSGGWKYTVDFEIDENMVSERGTTPYDTNYRFIDFEGTSTNSTITVNSADLGGKLYFDADGKALLKSDFTDDTTLYARWIPIKYKPETDPGDITDGEEPDIPEEIEFGKEFTISTGTMKREFTLTFDGKGGTPAVNSVVAKSPFNGWQDHNSIVAANGVSYPWYAFNAPFYANSYSDIKNSLGYDKAGLVTHWIANTINGTANRNSSEFFNLDYYMANGGTDLKNAYGSNRNAYVNHWITDGYSENRNGVASKITNVSANYPANAVVKNLSTTDGATVTLKAQWGDAKASTTTATRKGYIFQGWYDNPEYTGTPIDAGTQIVLTKDTTLYAKWTPIKYVIRFDGNGADDGEMEDQIFTYDKEDPLNENKYTKEDYFFGGWSTEPDGDIVYYDKDKIFNLTDQDGEVIVLYAKWISIPTLHIPSRVWYVGDEVKVSDILENAKAYDADSINPSSNPKGSIKERVVIESLDYKYFENGELKQGNKVIKPDKTDDVDTTRVYDIIVTGSVTKEYEGKDGEILESNPPVEDTCIVRIIDKYAPVEEGDDKIYYRYISGEELVNGKNGLETLVNGYIWSKDDEYNAILRQSLANDDPKFTREVKGDR